LALTDPDWLMRDTFCMWCRDSGLSVTVDRVGNIFARRQGTEDLRPVMVGSHLDTQVAGGRYDGALGVLTGLEIVRWLQDQGAVTRHPVEIVSWSNEEGARFRPPMLGSAVFAGALPLDRALATTDDAGMSFGAELERIGYAGVVPVPGAAPSAYFEFHIEQDDILEQRGADLGVVTSAFPVRGMAIRFEGETAHAGSTPMSRRRDALVGAAEVVAALPTLAERHGDQARASTTRMDVWPGCTGIIPSEVVLTVDFRHPQDDALAEMTGQLDRIIQRACERRGLGATTESVWEFGSGLAFDRELAAVVRRWAQRLGVETIDMASVAGHDAYWLATIAPAQIVFVPCVGGVTHNEHEDIDYARVLRSANVLAAAVLDAAR